MKAALKAARRQLAIDNAKQPPVLKAIPREDNGVLRVSVCRTSLSISGDRWSDGISWEELQQVKREIGRGDKWAVELYPADIDVVNVANMRHLWLIAEAPAFAWRKPEGSGS